MLRYVLILFLFSIVLIGCGSSDVDFQAAAPQPSQPSQSLKPQNGFAEHELTTARPLVPGQVAALFMEPRDAVTVEHEDSGTLGVDLVPLRFSETKTYSFAFDPNGGTLESAELQDSDGAVLLTLNASTTSGSVFLSPGDYTLVLASGYTVQDSPDLDHQVVFLHPAPLQGQSSVFHQLLSSQGCSGCDLSKADMSGAYLVGASFAGSNLTEANFSHADLTSADLSYTISAFTDFTKANMLAARFDGANMTGAILQDAVAASGSFFSTILIEANLTNCILDNAKMVGTDLTGADATGVDFTVVDLFEDVITDGCIGCP